MISFQRHAFTLCWNLVNLFNTYFSPFNGGANVTKWLGSLGHDLILEQVQRRLESYKAEGIFLQIKMKAAPLVTAQYHTILLDSGIFANAGCAWIVRAFSRTFLPPPHLPKMTRERWNLRFAFTVCKWDIRLVFLFLFPSPSEPDIIYICHSLQTRRGVYTRW